MYLVNLYGQFEIEGATESAVLENNTIVLVPDLEIIPPDIFRWYGGDWEYLHADGSGGIRVGHEKSGMRIVRNADGTYTAIKYIAGWQPFEKTGSIQECVRWLDVSPFAQ